MPTRKFALETGGPKRLSLSWGFRWKDFIIRLDDQEIGRIDGGSSALREGRKFALPNGTTLRVLLTMEKSWAGKASVLLLTVDGMPVPGSDGTPLPKWAYLFMAACAAIPLITLGGAIPAAIGLGGAGACAGIARDESRTPVKRAAYCAGVTLACWGVFGAFLVVVGAWKSP